MPFTCKFFLQTPDWPPCSLGKDDHQLYLCGLTAVLLIPLSLATLIFIVTGLTWANPGIQLAILFLLTG